MYKKFLDILNEYQKDKYDLTETMRRISGIFAGYPDLIQGFDDFTPPGYSVQCESENKLDTVRITTPRGTTEQDNTPGRDTERSPNGRKR